MTKLHFFSDKLRQIARNQYKLHGFLKEWQLVIYLLIVLKLAAMAFSIFAGYEYLRNFFFELLNSSFLSLLFTWFGLILLEFLTMFWLSKFWKFALRLKLKAALLPFVGAIIFFSVSFILSTNGLAIRQSSKADNTEILTKQESVKTLNINMLYDSRREEIKDQIATIKNNPQGWSKGKRTILLSSQLNQIDKYYSDLQELEKEHKKDLVNLESEFQDKLNLNQVSLTSEAEKYYKIVSGIMVIILLINGLLMFFYGRVWMEAEKEQATTEAISTLSTDIESRATDLIQTRISDVFAMFFSALQVQFEDNKPQLGTQQNKPISIGFQNRKVDTGENTPVNQNKPYARNTAVNNARTPVEHGSGTCPNCGKSFKKHSYNHTYCSEVCRIEMHEKRTGKDLSRFKKLHR